MERPTLLIVDDEKHTRDGLRRALQERFEIYLAGDLKSAETILDAETVDLVLTDLRLNQDSEGMKLLEKCQGMTKPPVCVMMTAYGSVHTAVEAMRRGAYDYVTKPVNIDKLEMLLLRAWKSKKVEQENVQLRKELNIKFGVEQIIGASPKMLEIFEIVRQVAESRAAVLIEGESGTGKELIARAIHHLSPRKNKSFVAVHCAALSPQLLESELFGHERGSFTGAHERRIGRFEQADKGTIFLDEIGEIDASTQVKLLRVLGEKKFERVGGNQEIEVDVRLVVATNRNLEAMVKEGKFREDLFYRIHVVRIGLPPLRERREDIPLLTQAFLKEFCSENKKKPLQLSQEAEQIFLHYDWPGNVRELRTAAEHGVVLARGDEITLKDLPPTLNRFQPQTTAPVFRSLNLEETEKKIIAQALAKCGDNRTEAAKLLGISRRTLHRKLHEIGESS
ncbi:MAG: sigma-54 dependent transcriptional regulator [bacterium]